MHSAPSMQRFSARLYEVCQGQIRSVDRDQVTWGCARCPVPLVCRLPSPYSVLCHLEMPEDRQRPCQIRTRPGNSGRFKLSSNGSGHFVGNCNCRDLRGLAFKQPSDPVVTLAAPTTQMDSGKRSMMQQFWQVPVAPSSRCRRSARGLRWNVTLGSSPPTPRDLVHAGPRFVELPSEHVDGFHRMGRHRTRDRFQKNSAICVRMAFTICLIYRTSSSVSGVALGWPFAPRS